MKGEPCASASIDVQNEEVKDKDGEKLAQDGARRNSEANRLITESQDLFALRKPTEAIQLLRQAYELDKKNSLARAILANALVEHAHSLVETDWLQAETLTNQALGLNPAHPTAKTIRNLIVERKRTSTVEDWVAPARKLQSSGDLFAALAWVAEGLAIHPDEPRLLQIQAAIQRDQGARRRQTRRGDLEDLRRMEREIDQAEDAAAKQALAGRIQAAAAKYWTDGEILAIANRLLSRLGFGSQQTASASPQGRGPTVIFHVPRPSAPEASRAAASQVQTSIEPLGKIPATPPKPQLPTPPPGSIAAPVPAAIPAAKPVTVPSAATANVSSPASRPAPASELTPAFLSQQGTRSHSTTVILISAAAMIVLAAVFFLFARKHQAPLAVKNIAAPPAVAAPIVSAPADSAPVVSEPAPTPESSAAAVGTSSDRAGGQVTQGERSSAARLASDRGSNLGTLLVVAGQDDARVFLDGTLQPRLTQGGRLRLPNLKPKDYVVQVSKSGFQDPPPQKIRIRKGEEAGLIFNLQNRTLQNLPPQPLLATLTVQGGTPGTTVLVDQTLVGTVQADGTLSASTVAPGDHTIELRRERFKSRLFKKHFVAGGTISLAAADAVLEAAPGELKITFTPADANVAVVKGELLKIVSSGVPLSLPAGSYTLTARTADRYTRWSTLEVVAGQSQTLDLSLAPTGMSKWDDPGSWKQEKDSFIRKGGDFVLYGAAPASGTFAFSATPAKGHLLQWVVHYIDARNYVFFQMDDNNFYRAVIRNGQKTDEITIPNRADKKGVRTLQIRVSPGEIVHQVKHGESSVVVDRWTQPGANLGLGKFGFYIPGNEQVALFSFTHYADLNIR